jgi:SPASM domain peptide maturase of grasp-with-spasm system
VSTIWSDNLDKYLHLYADCIPVKGALKSAIYDLTNRSIIFFQSDFYEVIQYLISDRVGIILEKIQSEKIKKLVIEFIEFLEQYELITFLDDTSMFPAIEEKWEIPAIVQNAIIDLDTIVHDFGKIFSELDALGCQFVQIRCFSNLLKIEKLNEILSLARHKSIESVELILKYDEAISDRTYIGLVEEHPIIASLTIHSASQERTLTINYGCDDDLSPLLSKEIYFVTQTIDSQLHCGLIDTKHLNAPNVANFFETKLYNGCLNRKVSIDALGEIKNCPSMSESYGNIEDTSLNVAIDKLGFQDKWHITKDQIETCKDCELRYACSDCRAYLENPQDIYSKPLKCGYNPYSGEWEEWSKNPLKKMSIEYYEIPIN